MYVYTHTVHNSHYVHACVQGLWQHTQTHTHLHMYLKYDLQTDFGWWWDAEHAEVAYEPWSHRVTPSSRWSTGSTDGHILAALAEQEYTIYVSVHVCTYANTYVRIRTLWLQPAWGCILGYKQRHFAKVTVQNTNVTNMYRYIRMYEFSLTWCNLWRNIVTD